MLQTDANEAVTANEMNMFKNGLDRAVKSHRNLETFTQIFFTKIDTN